MKSTLPSNHHARAKFWTALMYSLSLAHVTSASPASMSLAFAVSEPTTSPNELRLSSSNSTTSNNNYEENSNRIFNYYLIIVALVAIFFCVIVFCIQHRKKKSVKALTAENVEDAPCRDMTIDQMATVSDLVSDGFQVNRNRVDIFHEGLDEQGEAPPPYVPNFKTTSVEQANGSSATCTRYEATSSNQNINSTEPPPYNEYTIPLRTEDSGDIGQARPLPLTNTETSGNL